MRLLTSCLFALIVSLASSRSLAAPAVQTGLDVLRDQKFTPLKGKRVGVVTNHTGVDANGTHLVDLLLMHDVKIAKLFSPEHGLYGTKDEKVGDTTDAKTGLPVLSLYGKTRRPTPEMLAGLDVLVFDIQDIGTRYYTYISTMGYCMEEAAKAGVEFVVLDRPNPIGGDRVEGPIAEKAHLSFTAYGPLPVVHGMTVGELAKLFNAEYGIDAKLTVIELKGYQRSMDWDATGLTWVNPSPNMRNPTAALLYPAIGLLESSNVSVGRGTDVPFEVFGAPWIDAEQFAAKLTSLNLPGLKFEPTTFTPRNTHHKLNNEACHGVRVRVMDKTKVDAVVAGCAFAWTLEAMYPEQWRDDLFVKMVQSDRAVAEVLKLKDPTKANAIWSDDLTAFRKVRDKHLLYR